MKRLLRSILRMPVRFVRAASTRARSIFADMAGRHRRLSSLYFAIAARDFDREHFATLAGIRSYSQALAGDSGNSALLRRNIHRLEKGLLMRPMRPVFGLDYIADTVAMYARRLAAGASVANGDRELQWASEVLERYFDTIDSHPISDCARETFRSSPEPLRAASGPLSPYARDLSRGPPVSYDALHQLAIQRRSVRWYLDKKVPHGILEKALAIAAESPSACNRQPFQFRFFDEPEMLRKVVSLPMGTSGFGPHLPSVAVIVGQQRHFFDPRDRHLIYIDGALAAMSFALAMETLGLATCLINWPDVAHLEKAMQELIGLAEDERVVMLIGYGYPDPEGLVAASAKKPISDLARFN